MRSIGSLPDESRARRFGDYLLWRGMSNQVELGSSGAWDVWVEDDDDLDAARRELQEFKAEPDAARYDGISSEAQRIRREQEQRSERLRRNFTDVRTQWSRPAGAPRVTLVVLALAVVVAMLTQLGYRSTPALQWLLFAPYSQAVVPEGETGDDGPSLFVENIGFAGAGMFDAIARGQVWRLFTPALIHFGPIHLVFNLYWLFFFGTMIELRKGSLLFGLLVVAGALIGNLAEAAWIHFDLLDRGYAYAAFGGLSGVNYALFGYAWLSGRLRPADRVGTDPTTALILFVWLVLCMTGAMGPVANTAHLAGLGTGLFLARLNPRFKRRRR